MADTEADDTYSGALRREIMRSEQQRMRVLVIILAAVLAAAMFVLNLIPEIDERLFDNKVPGWVPLEGALLPLALLMGLLSVGGQLLFTYGMGFTTATSGSATTQLVPVLAWFFGVTLLSEPVLPLSALGAVLCVGGVLLGALRPKVSAQPVAAPLRE